MNQTRFVLAFAFAAPVAASATVGLDSTHFRALPSAFFGVNGQNRGGIQWGTQTDGSPGWNSSFEAAIGDMSYGILRFPGGTGSNYWDWQAGDLMGAGYTDSNSDGGSSPQYWDGTFAPSAFVSKVNELYSEVGATQASPLIVLNLLTDPTDTKLDSYGYASFTDGPNLSYQMSLLSTLTGATDAPPDGLGGYPLQYVELGNEYYLTGMAGYDIVYPDPVGTDGPPAAVVYARIATTWISAIKDAHPGLKVAAVGCYPSGTSRTANWDDYMLMTDDTWSGSTDHSEPALQGADAITFHVYPSSGLTDGSNVNTTNADTMLATPFSTWTSMQANKLGSNLPSGMGVWVTEYNLDDQKSPVFGTWAHGLFTAAMGLLFLENPSVQMALHHCVVEGTAVYPDIFSSTDAFVTPAPGGTPPNPPYYPNPNPDPDTFPTDGNGGGGESWVFPTDAGTHGSPNPAFDTAEWSNSATGVTQTEINVAAGGQTHAERLTFPGISRMLGSTGYEVVYGWTFNGNGSTYRQAVILNLDSEAHPVDLSALFPVGAQFTQIYGDPGAYVTNGGTLAGVNASGSSDDLTANPGSLTSADITSFSLPAFSLTTVYTTALTDADIGSPGQAGSASFSSGTWTVNGGGTIVAGNTSDMFNYASEPIAGNLTLSAEVTSVGDTDTYAKAGVMIRDTTADNAANVLVSIGPDGSARMTYRSTDGGATASAGTLTGYSAPAWVELVSSGSTFTGYASTDGSTWTKVGQTTATFGSSTNQAGLAVTANDNSKLCTGTFTNYSLVPVP